MKKLPNPYDCLMADGPDGSEPIEASATWCVTDSRKEVVNITTAVMPDGRFVYGYSVYWAKGGNSSAKPSAERGIFNSQREAKLHCLGFFLGYCKYFLDETQEALLAAEKEMLQTSIFDF